MELRKETLRWNEEGKSEERPFKTYYTRKGILVRAEYVSQHPDDSLASEPPLERRQSLIAQHGQSIVGLPNQPPPVPLTTYLEYAKTWAYPAKAQRIWVDYVLYSWGPETAPGPAVIVSLWGGGSSNGFEVVDRIRLVFRLDGSGDFSVDNAL